MELLEAHRVEADWLPPIAALAHFEPPPGLYLAAADHVRREEKRARYGFRVGGLRLLIGLDAGSEVLMTPQIAPLPGAPRGFLGLANLRGGLVPMYDLRILLGVAAGPADAEVMALVFGQGDEAVGILIEGHPLALGDLRPLADFPQLPDALEKHVSAGYMQDANVWLEFDHTTFFEEICNGGNSDAV